MYNVLVYYKKTTMPDLNTPETPFEYIPWGIGAEDMQEIWDRIDAIYKAGGWALPRELPDWMKWDTGEWGGVEVIDDPEHPSPLNS